MKRKSVIPGKYQGFNQYLPEKYLDLKLIKDKNLESQKFKVTN